MIENSLCHNELSSQSQGFSLLGYNSLRTRAEHEFEHNVHQTLYSSIL